MSRTINMHLSIEVPPEDGRDTLEIVGAVETALIRPVPALRGLKIETVLAEVVPNGEPITFYTVHPFDDEWTWDPNKSGAHPWVTPSLQEAIDHANLIRLEYASTPDVDKDWIAGFWSSIYADDEEDPDPTVTGEMYGWVDPLGNFNEGSHPPIDEEGNWIGESGKWPGED